MNQEATYETKRVHLDNLYRMVSYCENIVDCRRAQQLEYFGETFDRKFCRENPRAICDSCSSTVSSSHLLNPHVSSSVCQIPYWRWKWPLDGENNPLGGGVVALEEWGHPHIGLSPYWMEINSLFPKKSRLGLSACFGENKDKS